MCPFATTVLTGKKRHHVETSLFWEEAEYRPVTPRSHYGAEPSRRGRGSTPSRLYPIRHCPSPCAPADAVRLRLRPLGRPHMQHCVQRRLQRGLSAAPPSTLRTRKLDLPVGLVVATPRPVDRRVPPCLRASPYAVDVQQFIAIPKALCASTLLGSHADGEYGSCTDFSTSATATSSEAQAPPPAAPVFIAWHNGSSEGRLAQQLSDQQGMMAKSFSVEVEVASVRSIPRARSAASEDSLSGQQSNTSPGAADQPGAAASAGDGQAVRILLRLWPLARFPHVIGTGQVADKYLSPSIAHGSCVAVTRGISDGSLSRLQVERDERFQLEQETERMLQPREARADTAGRQPSGAAAPGWLPAEMESMPALSHIEHLLDEAAAAATAAAADAVAARLQTEAAASGDFAAAEAASSFRHQANGGAPHGSSRLASADLKNVCGSQFTSVMVDPEAFFQPDGSLLKGAVLQAACNLIRLMELPGGVMIVPPRGTTCTGAQGATMYSSACGGGPTSVSPITPTSTRPQRRYAVPLAGALQLLASYAGAARALQNAEARAEAATATATATAANVYGRGQVLAAEGITGFRPLWPLMKRGLDCAEVLMAYVARAICSPR